MIKAIESNLYKIERADNHDDIVFDVTVKETGSSIAIFKLELQELVELLQTADKIIN